MRSLGVLLFFGIFMVVFQESQALESSHLKQFHIVQCREQNCFTVQGDIGFMSMSQEVLFAENVKLSISSSQSSTQQEQTCAIFRYDIHSQYLMCDNRENPGFASLTIDSKFKISKFANDRKNKS